MKLHYYMYLISGLALGLLFTISGCDNFDQSDWQWESIDAVGTPTARHEAAFVAYQDKIYLIGGRRINPTDEFDTKSNTWTEKSAPPIELHHFQPVVIDDAIYLMGAMTGGWPLETPLDRIIIYYPERDEYVYGDEVPPARRRGGAGVVVYNNKIYLVGGITNGHMDGFKPWLDEYDPATGQWRILPDAPNARDHFQAAVVDNKLYAFGGRASSRKTGEDMSRTIQHGNIFDFETETWLPVTNQLAIPTMRAGSASFSWNDEIITGGGESATQEPAHDQLESFNSKTNQWNSWPSLIEGRHGSGFAIVDDYVYMASGSGNRGGGPELTSIERLRLPPRNIKSTTQEIDETPVYAQWQTITHSFEGPETSEDAEDNPFLNYQLQVKFKHAEIEYDIRGYYAADGNSAESSAKSGNIWQVRFTPDRPGAWSYQATLHYGDSVALLENPIEVSQQLELTEANGTFVVAATDTDGPDFRAYGRLIVDHGYFRFQGSKNYWIKGGADSPENFLAYEDFDDTYRFETSSDDGEASTDEQIHRYYPHLYDWQQGDPTWKDGKGKSIIGAINYLAAKKMNVIYFIVNNINGDGKDVWPYTSPEEFTRFDVSKLEQWEIVFQHMQSKGIMMHLVLQETENETMLDDGDTGPLRKLYLSEMIARFGHHNGLKWNLGEENGPAPFTPIAQDDRQRRDMIKYISENDPYDHPILLHTHSHDPPRRDVLQQILGYNELDGLSLQVDQRQFAPGIVSEWKKKSHDAGHEWLISMDEIGKWDTGALPDSQDPDHETLRRYVLWGTLLSGSAGVEWYFGANNQHNDLNTEDWRSRDRLWDLTRYAMNFFEVHLPYWEMEPANRLVSVQGAYTFAKSGEAYAVYLPPGPRSFNLDLRDATGTFNIQWFDPLVGDFMDSNQTVSGGNRVSITIPTKDQNQVNDWVCLIKGAI